MPAGSATDALRQAALIGADLKDLALPKDKAGRTVVNRVEVTNYLGPYTVTPIGTSQRRRRIAGRSLSGVPIVSLIRIPLAASRCDRQRGNPVVRLSAHIQREMQGRGITQAYIEEVLANPTYTAPDPTDPTLTRSFGPLPAFGNRMLRVVHRPDGSDVFVVTATWDRGATP